MIALQMSEQDNTAVVVQDVPTGAVVMVGGTSVIAKDPVPKGHKLALSPIAAGRPIIKYGKVIGCATADIQTGQWVHTHNVEDITQQLCEEYAAAYRNRGSV